MSGTKRQSVQLVDITLIVFVLLCSVGSNPTSDKLPSGVEVRQFDRCQAARKPACFNIVNCPGAVPAGNLLKTMRLRACNGGQGMTVKYANTKEEATLIALKMRQDEPEYSNDVKIETTCEDSFGIYKAVDKGKFVIHNETE